MNRRSPFVLCALAVASLVAACGGSDDTASSGPAGFSGVYRPADPGPIGSITFNADASYLLMPSGCRERACSESGTYRFDTEARSLLLEDAATGRARAIAVEVLRTTSTAGTSLVKSLRPQGDLIDPGEQLTTGTGQQLNQGNGQRLNQGNGQQLNQGDGQKLAEVGQKLLELIQQAMMNGQNMNRDNGNNDNANNNNNNNQDRSCQNPPVVTASKADIDAYWARCPNGP